MNCQQTHDLLHGYIDGELDLVRNVEIERHFDECQSCALTRQKQLGLRSLIRDGAPYFDAPDVLRKRITNQLRAGNKTEAIHGLMSRRRAGGGFRGHSRVVRFADLGDRL